MIVNARDSGWEIIYQRSHALLAAILVEAWREEQHIPRWTELVVAVAQHDDQEMFWDGSRHLTALGAPLDFTQGELDTTREQAQAVIANAYRQGLWVALLVSRHNSFLHEPKRGQDTDLDDFLDEQQRNQEHWCDILGYSKDDLEQAYTFLRWGDRLSLILCREQLPERERWLDVAPGIDGEMIRIQQRANDTLALWPWVLEHDKLQVSVEVRHLSQLKFADDDEFLEALDAAKIRTRQWTFCK